MRRCAGNHSLSTRAKSLAVLVMAVSTLAQFLALSHEVKVRHFRCAEHGELTHLIATASDLPPLEPRRGGNAIRTQLPETVDAHEHCATAFTVEGSAAAPVIRVAARFTPPSSVSNLTPVIAPQLGRPFVLASAPKTSPPSA